LIKGCNLGCRFQKKAFKKLWTKKEGSGGKKKLGIKRTRGRDSEGPPGTPLFDKCGEGKSGGT